MEVPDLANVFSQVVLRRIFDLLIIITSNIHPYHYHDLLWALRREQYVLWQCRRSRCASQKRIEPNIIISNKIVKITGIIVIIVVIAIAL